MHLAKSFSVRLLFEGRVSLVLYSYPSLGNRDAATLVTLLDELSHIKKGLRAHYINPSQVLRKHTANLHIYSTIT